MTTKVILHELRVSCSIGIDAAERYVRQLLLLDIDITLENAVVNAETPGCDYHQAVRQLRALAAAQHYGLMETFAETAAAMLLENPRVQAVRVYCRKPAPFADVGSAGVEVVRRRAEALPE